MEDAGDRRGQKAVHPIVEPEGRTNEQELGERPLGEAQGDLDRDRLGVRPNLTRPEAAAGRGNPRPVDARRAKHPERQGQPGFGLAGPAKTERRDPEPRLGLRSRFDLGGGEQMGEWVQVVADPDPPFGTGLERARPAAAERVEDDVTGARVAGDEGVGEGRRKARQVRAHRVESMTPQPLLVLPLGGQGQARQVIGGQTRQIERELSAGRHGRSEDRRRRPGGSGRRWAGGQLAIPVLAVPRTDPGGTTGRGA